MNKDRRLALQIIAQTLESAKGDIETFRDEEQEYHDNMPESLQGGEKGDQADNAIVAMDEAMDSLDSAIQSLETAVE